MGHECFVFLPNSKSDIDEDEQAVLKECSFPWLITWPQFILGVRQTNFGRSKFELYTSRINGNRLEQC